MDVSIGYLILSNFLIKTRIFITVVSIAIVIVNYGDSVAVSIIKNVLRKNRITYNVREVYVTEVYLNILVDKVTTEDQVDQIKTLDIVNVVKVW